MECTICPTINIKNNDGAICSVKHCILQAALKYSQERHQICGKEVELTLEEAASPEEVAPEEVMSDEEIADANQFAGIDPENIIDVPVEHTSVEGELVDEPR